MTKRLTLLAGVLLGSAALALGQNSTTYESTRQNANGSVTTTRTTFSGPVVSYQPGQTIVLREDGRTVSYMLSPSTEIPSDVAVGKMVTITTTPDTRTVTRVVTTETAPGQTTVTKETSYPGGTTTTKETTAYGTVSAFTPGQSMTITEKHGKRVTYIVTDQSQMPTSIKIGKKVRVYTIPAPGSNQVIVKRVTETTTENPE